MTATTVTRPLASMTSLTKDVLIYDPLVSSNAAPSSSSRNPALIVLLTWMEARDIHIQKYITHHQGQFPTSRILLIKCSMWDVIFTENEAAAVENLKPAASFLRDTIDCALSSGSPLLLLHAFSNGGSIKMHQLRIAFERMTAKPLPLHATIFDSAPGLNTYGRGKTAFASWAAPGSLAHLLVALPLAHLLMCLYWLAYVPWGRVDALTRVSRSHNDPTKIPNEACRSYIYSKEDIMIDWRHVELHAKEAESNGFKVRSLERFNGSHHVLHMKEDQERYWRVVRGALTL